MQAPPRCGAKTKGSGKTCRNWAGKRTDHPGQGPCYLQGGGSHIKHGFYARYLHGSSVRDLVAAFEQQREQMLDLVPEMWKSRNDAMRKESRTRGHVFCSMLALKLSRELERRLQAAFRTTDHDPHASVGAAVSVGVSDG